MNDKTRNPKRKGAEDPTKKKKEEKKRDQKKYDLEERTAVFGESIIDFVKTLPYNVVNKELIRQLVKAGTSVGANYNEADGAESKKDFRHKIAICRKESKESKFWLRMIARANPDRKNDCKGL
jgi:four helix bundle protein